MLEKLGVVEEDAFAFNADEECVRATNKFSFGEGKDDNGCDVSAVDFNLPETRVVKPDVSALNICTPTGMPIQMTSPLVRVKLVK